jgi:hypothetical protein
MRKRKRKRKRIKLSQDDKHLKAGKVEIEVDERAVRGGES